MIIANLTNFSISLKNKSGDTTTTESPIKYYKRNSLELPNYTYNQLQIKRNNLSFKGIQGVEFLEKRINAKLMDLRDDEVCIFGKDLSEAREHLSKYTGRVLNRIFFIEEPSINGVFSAMKNSYGGVNITNLVDSSVKVNDLPVIYSGIFQVPIRTSNMPVTKTKITIGDNNFYIDLNEKIKSSPDINNGVQEILLSGKESEKDGITAYTNAQRISIKIPLPSSSSKPGKITFADVGGHDEVIGQLKKYVIYPIRNEKFYRNNKMLEALTGGVLLYGLSPERVKPF